MHAATGANRLVLLGLLLAGFPPIWGDEPAADVRVMSFNVPLRHGTGW